MSHLIFWCSCTGRPTVVLGTGRHRGCFARRIEIGGHAQEASRHSNRRLADHQYSRGRTWNSRRGCTCKRYSSSCPSDSLTPLTERQTQEAHRPKLIAVERLILQTICFNFNLHRAPFVATETSSSSVAVLLAFESGIAGRDVFGWVIRLARALNGVFILHWVSSIPLTFLSIQLPNPTLSWPIFWPSTSTVLSFPCPTHPTPSPSRASTSRRSSFPGIEIVWNGEGRK